MECKHVQSLIPQYLADELESRELEAFIRHVETCPECYDELETYFMLNRALKFLDDENGSSYNLKSLLEKDIRTRKHQLAGKRRRQTLWLIFCALGLLVVLLAGIDAAGLLNVPYFPL